MRKFAAPVLLFLLCVGFYWKLTLTDQYTFLDSPDLAHLDLPRLQFQASGVILNSRSGIPIIGPASHSLAK